MAGTGLSDSDGNDFIVAKYDTGLNSEIWRRSYDGPTTSGDEEDEVFGMVLDDAGNVYLVGTSAGNGTGKDIALQAWSSTGTPLWTARYDRIENSVSLDDYATGICIDASGNLCVSGYTVDGNLDNDALAIVFEPDGDIKSGWPQVYGASNFNERFNAIASDASSGVAAAGYKVSQTSDSDILMCRFAGNGSLEQDIVTDVADGADIGFDITYTKNGHIAVASTAYVDSGTRIAVHRFDEEETEATWEEVIGSHSVAQEPLHIDWCDMAYGEDFIYVAGTYGSAPKFITVKLEVSDGDPSSTWASIDGAGNGIRLFDAHGGHSVNSIWSAGTNVYIGGSGWPTSDTPQKSYYAGVGYGSSGGVRWYDFHPNTQPVQDSIGYGLSDFCAGQIYFTGELHLEVLSEVYDDAGTLWYDQNPTTEAPESGTVEFGGLSSGSLSNLGASDNSYAVFEMGSPSTGDPHIIVRVEGNVGGGVTELCFEVESRTTDSATTQKIELYNYDSGQYVVLDSRACTTTDRTIHVTVPRNLDPDRFIDGSGNVKARIKFYDAGSSSEWLAYMDMARWKAL